MPLTGLMPMPMATPLPLAQPVIVPPTGIPVIDVPGIFAGRVSAWTVMPSLSLWLLDTGFVILVIIVLTLASLRLYQAFLRRIFSVINHNLKPGAEMRVAQRSNTLSGILASLGRVVILFMGLTIVLAKVGLNVAPLLASAGIAGLAVGFGAQSLVKDVISGFFILTEDQFGIGDVIEVDGKQGLVEHMNLRITQLRNQHGQLITIPNGQILAVINHSKEWARTVLEVGVPYDEDPDRVIRLLEEIGHEVQAQMPDKVLEPIEVLGVDAFREHEVIIKLQIKTRPLEQWIVGRAYRRLLLQRFKEQNIGFPFPQRMLWLASAGSTQAIDELADIPTNLPPTPPPAQP